MADIVEEGGNKRLMKSWRKQYIWRARLKNRQYTLTQNFVCVHNLRYWFCVKSMFATSKNRKFNEKNKGITTYFRSDLGRTEEYLYNFD